MQKLKTEKGITLIALVITIIVMLILVGVSVTVALNGGLFSTAQGAARTTEAEKAKEQDLASGRIKVGNTWYDSLDAYKRGEISQNQDPQDPEGGNGGGSGEKVVLLPKKDTYTVGEPVTIGEESFYVIADTTGKVTLLAKDCIDTTNLVQSSSGNVVAFSTEKYWEEGSEHNITEPEPMLDGETQKLTLPVSHIAAKAAYDYGVKVGGTGRLITYSEAKILKPVYEDIIYGINGKSSTSYLIYWLSSYNENSSDSVLFANGYEDGSDEFRSLTYANPFDFPSAGVRPVVEILKSNIE